jgi:putative heme transporter
MKSKQIKVVINVVTILALGVLIFYSWDQIANGLKEIFGAKLSVVFLMIPLQLVNYYAVAKFYHSYFRASNQQLSMKLMYKIALELNFVNHILPSGGVAGFSYLGLRLKRYGVPISRTTLAQTMRFGFTFISFLIILFMGMFLLSFGSGRSGGGLALFIGLSIAFLTLFFVVVVAFIISSENRIKVFTAFLPKLFNRILKNIVRKNVINVEKIERMFIDLHKDYITITKQWRCLKKPFWWAFWINATEIGTAYLAYIALGQLVNPGAVILAYSVASFAGLISILPGGIGVYEALMTGVLASAGVPKALALSATLVYRITCMIIFLPVGFVLYQMALRKGDAEAPTNEPDGSYPIAS